MVGYGQVESISPQRVRLADARFVPYYPDESLLLLGKDLLDQQIVDVNGRKVVRVNDVALRVEQTCERDELWVQGRGRRSAGRLSQAGRRRVAGQDDSAPPGAHQAELDPLGILQHCRAPIPGAG